MKLQTASSILALLVAGAAHASAASTYEWDLDGNTNAAQGTGVLSILPGTPTTSFGTTTIGGQSTGYLNVPKMTSNTNQGVTLTFPSSGPNGGGSYINQYTLVFDINIAAPVGNGYEALLQTSPANASGNDADFYITNTGAGGGTAAMGSSAAGAFTFNAWHRVALDVNLTAGSASYYVDGTNVFTTTSLTSAVDGRYSLNSNTVAGAAALLFNEGFDTTGSYTEATKVSAIGFTDTALSSSQVAALGSASAAPIFAAVPEPSAGYLAVIAALLFGAGRYVSRTRSTKKLAHS